MQHKFTHHSKTHTPNRGGSKKRLLQPIFCALFLVAFSPVFAQGVVANDDVAHVLKGGSVTVDVLRNDTDTAANTTLNLDKIVLTNYGKATVENGKIRFTPNADFVGTGLISYTVCNTNGDCACGSVAIEVARRPLPTHDSNDNARLFVTQESDVRFILPLGYLPVEESEGMVRQSANAGEWIYTHKTEHGSFPQVSFSTIDNGTLKGYDVKFEVLKKAPQYVVNDVASTAIGEPVTFNVLANDKLPANFASLTYGNANGGTIEALSNGTVTFTPNIPVGGVANFEYAITTLEGYTEKATVFINVSNFLPKRDEYRLVCSGVPTILNFNTPIGSVHNISVLDEAKYGKLSFFAVLDTVINGKRLTGKNVLVYFPNLDEGFYTDDFVLEYCLGDDCKPVYLEMEVMIPQSEDQCLTDCVWPGDANADGAVNVLDIYPIGLNIGSYGKKRTDDTNEWFAHSADDWGKKTNGAASLDLKHADSNGDGLIDSSDVTAILKNYNSFAAVTPTAGVQESDVQLQLSSAASSLRPGDMFEITVSVGSAENPAFNMSGTSFSVGYNANLVQEKSVNVNFTKSGWLARYEPHLMVSKIAERGKLEAGLVKTKSRGSNGHGEVGKVRGIIVSDIVIWRQNGNSTVKFTLDDMHMMNSSGQMVKLKGATIEIPLNTGKKTDEAQAEDLFAFPNPTSDVFNFFVNGDNSIKTVRLLDMSGREVARLNQVNAKSAILNVNSVSNGLYIAEVLTEKGRLVKKVEVMK